MAGTAAARYYTNREWREYESEAARRSRARAAARAERRAAAAGRTTVPDRAAAGRRAAAAQPAARPAARPAAEPSRRPQLRVVPRSRKRARSIVATCFLFSLALLLCCGAVPVLLNMAAFHYKAEAAAMEKLASSLRTEQKEYATQAAALGSTARLQEKAELLGLEHVSSIATIQVPTHTMVGSTQSGEGRSASGSEAATATLASVGEVSEAGAAGGFGPESGRGTRTR